MHKTAVQLYLIDNHELSVIILPCVIFWWQLRSCPHLEQDVLSECLSLQLHSSTPSQHLFNGKDTRSPALGQDVYSGSTHDSGKIISNIFILGVSSLVKTIDKYLTIYSRYKDMYQTIFFFVFSYYKTQGVSGFIILLKIKVQWRGLTI